MSTARSSVVRKPQQDRSRTTRLRLLETAVGCLAELGWANSSVVVVAERAGVSRGAAQHHFPTHEALFTAALAHMAEVRMSEFRRSVEALPEGADRTVQVLDLVTGIYRGTVFRAALQMWVAASVDEALRAKVLPLETRFARVVHATTVDLLGLDETQPGVRETVMTILDLARGLGLADVLSDDAVRRAAVLRQFAKLLDPNTQHPLTLVSAATLATTRKALP